MLSRDGILSADDLPRVRVAVPEWGGHVHVRGMTGEEREAFEAENTRLRKGRGEDDLSWYQGYRARLLVRSLCDESGALLFGPEDAVRLSGKSDAALERCYRACKPLSLPGEEDVVQEAGKSGGASSDAPGSASPSPSALPTPVS